MNAKSLFSLTTFLPAGPWGQSSAARATQAVQLLIVSKPPGGDPSIAYQLGNQDLWKTFFNLTSLFEFIA